MQRYLGKDVSTVNVEVKSMGESEERTDFQTSYRIPSGLHSQI